MKPAVAAVLIALVLSGCEAGNQPRVGGPCGDAGTVVCGDWSGQQAVLTCRGGVYFGDYRLLSCEDCVSMPDFVQTQASGAVYPTVLVAPGANCNGSGMACGAARDTIYRCDAGGWEQVATCGGGTQCAGSGTDAVDCLSPRICPPQSTGSGGGGSAGGVGGGGGGGAGGGNPSGCSPTAACGCSGKTKAQCGGACCNWVVGQGCGCR